MIEGDEENPACGAKVAPNIEISKLSDSEVE